MKIRDVILDFTTLLDITLILLFFFVLFSNVQVTDAASNASQKMQEAESLMADAQGMQEELSAELEHIKGAADRDGENIEGILEFDKGLNIKFVLDITNESTWQLNVYRGQEGIGNISCESDIGEELLELMEEEQYDANDTLICDYIYDGAKPGSLSAYRTMEDVIKTVKQKYKYFYYSETDISVLED